MDFDEAVRIEGLHVAYGEKVILTGLDWTKPELQDKYAGWFSPYLARRIAALPASTH